MKDVLPLARKDSLIVKEVDNETLVYDLETDQAHCLNDTAARIWKGCDGKSSVDDISRQLSAGLNAPVDKNVVWLALDQLQKSNLLSSGSSPIGLSGMSRRRAVQALGLAAIMLPVVTSLVVPTAQAAGSLTPDGECCNNPNECVSNCCHTVPVTTCTSPAKICGLVPSQSGPVCQDI